MCFTGNTAIRRTMCRIVRTVYRTVHVAECTVLNMQCASGDLQREAIEFGEKETMDGGKRWIMNKTYGSKEMQTVHHLR